MRIVERADRLARKVYLGMVCCPEKYAWQEPHADNARWYHLFCLLVPIVGILIFDEAIKNAKEHR